MPDVFDSVLGQERAIHALRHYAHSPVHAYLFVGAAGSGIDEALTAFSASLQCSQQGCGVCTDCRLVLSGTHSDVNVMERAGVSWSADEIREIERVSRRKPLGAGYQIVVVENIELAVLQIGRLLKILEEPPSRTIFLLTAESVPDDLDTVVSRCVEVAFAPLNDEVVAAYLERAGTDPVRARSAAAASNGDLTRARVLANDEELSDRIAQWHDLPEQLDGVLAHTCERVDEIIASIDKAIQPLIDLQQTEWARRTEDAKTFGTRSLPPKREVEARFKREQRRFRVEDFRFGLTSMAHAYRERLIEGLEGLDDGDRRSRVVVQGSIKSVTVIDRASKSLTTSVDERLWLTNLLVELAHQ